MSLRAKVLLPVAALGILLVLYLYGYWMPRSLAVVEAEHRRTTESHVASVVEGLIPLLLAHQLDAVYENLDFLKKRNNDWLAIYLVSPEGAVLYPLRPETIPPPRARGLRTVEQRIDYLDRRLGALIVVADFEPTLKALGSQQQELAAALLLVILAFVVAIGLVLDWVVRRPVNLLAQASWKLADGDFDAPLRKVGKDEVGALVESFASMRDAIRNYQSELLLRQQSLVKLSRAVEQSPAAIVITDSTGAIEFVNPKFTSVTGYRPEEVLGKNPRILKSGETPPEEYKRLWETITAGRVWYGVFHNKKKNGELFWESACISPIQNEQGRVTHFLAIKEDITERRRLEEQLRQAQKMEAVGQLAGGIAHDFNNILTAILGYGSMLRSKTEEGTQLHAYAEQILSVSRKAADLTRQLLAFSRKQIIRPRRVNLNEIISGLEKLSRRLLGEDVELRIALSAAELPVMVDPGQMEQVLLNLFTNARDAMPGGGLLAVATEWVELDEDAVSVRDLRHSGPYAKITVSDSGVGMDKNVLARIFEPFFTTKELGKGTGLGLSIVYGIVKQHGGAVGVYSEPGQGTTFRIYLPLAGAGHEEVRPAAAAAPRGGTETVLLAEDSDEVRDLARSVLEQSGYTVLAAADGEEAVALFAENRARIGLVLVDVIMPKKNGKEAVAEMRRLEPGVKVLYTSGYTADIIHKHGIFEEGLDFLAKPSTPEELLAKVREVLDKKTENHG